MLKPQTLGGVYMSELENKLKKEFKDKEYAHAYVNEFLNASIATQIKVLREQLGWKQEELASKTGMEQSRISLLENINYSMWSISTLKKLAEAFDVTLKVSFESFSTRINDIDNFNRESLERLSRENDLSFEEQTQPIGLASTNQSITIIEGITTSELFGTPKSLITADNKGNYYLQKAA